MTRNEFKNNTHFSLTQLASLFQKTVVRLWQLADEGMIKVSFKQEEVAEGRTRANRRGLKVHRDQVPVLMDHFKVNYLKDLHFEK